MTGYKFISLMSGEIYAVEMKDGEIVGVCGPLEYQEAIEANLPNFEYTVEDVEWIKEQE